MIWLVVLNVCPRKDDGKLNKILSVESYMQSRVKRDPNKSGILDSQSRYTWRKHI